MKTKTIGRLARILMLLIAAVLLFAGDRRAKAAGDLDEILTTPSRWTSTRTER